MTGYIEIIRGVLIFILLFGASYTDIRCRKVKNILTLPMILAGGFLCILSPEKDLVECIISIAAFSVLGTLHLMGMGDLKLLMAIASLNGMEFTLLTLFAGIAFMLAWCILSDLTAVRCALNNVRNFFLYKTPIPTEGKTKYPFALFLSAGAIAVFLMERTII